MAMRTWVSGVGDDVNPCSRTAPCKTFPGAISKTAAGGEINAIDPGGFGAITITKGMTLDGGEGAGFASILAASTNGIVINAGANDVVTIRNISINGAGTGIAGIRILAARAVFIENCEIFGFRAAAGTDAGKGIRDARSSGLLCVTGTTVRNNSASGIVVQQATGIASSVATAIDNCWLQGNGSAGVALFNGGRATISNSIITANTAFGVFADAAPGFLLLGIEGCVIANNNAGISLQQGSPTVHVSDTKIIHNNIGIQATTGAVASYGNNRISGNTSGNAPTTGAGIDLS